MLTTGLIAVEIIYRLCPHITGDRAENIRRSVYTPRYSVHFQSATYELIASVLYARAVDSELVYFRFCRLLVNFRVINDVKSNENNTVRKSSTRISLVFLPIRTFKRVHVEKYSIILASDVFDEHERRQVKLRVRFDLNFLPNPWPIQTRRFHLPR